MNRHLSPRRRSRRLLALAVVLGLGLASIIGPSADLALASASPSLAPAPAVVRQAEGSPAIVDGWVRAGMKGMNSAAYMTIQSAGDEDLLVGAASDVADATEVHRSFMESGVMRMEPAGPLTIPAGGAVDLAPGGYHVMLIGLHDDLAEGAEVSLTLQFDQAGAVTVSLPVRPMGGMGHR